MRTPLESKIFNIREYTKDHPELLNAHHFTYDLKIKDDQYSNRNYMVIGLNPGELGSWETCDEPTEKMNNETSKLQLWFNYFTYRIKNHQLTRREMLDNILTAFRLKNLLR